MYFVAGDAAGRDVPWTESAVKGGGWVVSRYRVGDVTIHRGRDMVSITALHRQ